MRLPAVLLLCYLGLASEFTPRCLRLNLPCGIPGPDELDRHVSGRGTQTGLHGLVQAVRAPQATHFQCPSEIHLVCLPTNSSTQSPSF